MTSALPVLLSIPHGGTETPPELGGRLCITGHDLFDDGDPFTDRIYGLGGAVQKVVSASVARAFVDLNRSLQDMPPANPDGLIKSMTCYRKAIYCQGREPGRQLREALIDRYYAPYHREIQKAVLQPGLRLCLDCHSMAPYAPPHASRPGTDRGRRPAFCLSNLDGKACPQETMELLAGCISESFGVGMGGISFNEPFRGGHITGTYGSNPVPWIQVEMNRDLYLAEPWFDGGSLSVKSRRLQELNAMFEGALRSFFARA